MKRKPPERPRKRSAAGGCNAQSHERQAKGEGEVRDLRQSRRLEILTGSKPYKPAGIGRRQGKDIGAARCNDFFPLTQALSLGERVSPSLRREQARPAGFPLRDARCSLSLRERVRVRGNGAKYPMAYWTTPGAVELG